MKSAQEKIRGVVKSHQVATNAPAYQRPKAIGKNLKFSSQKGIAFYFLVSKGWLPSITLGLLTALLGVTGILKAANADELQQGLETGQDSAQSPIPNSLSATTTTDSEVTEKNTDLSISVGVPVDPVAKSQPTEVPLSSPTNPNSADIQLYSDVLVDGEEAGEAGEDFSTPESQFQQTAPPASGLLMNVTAGYETETAGTEDRGQETGNRDSQSSSPNLPVSSTGTVSQNTSPPADPAQTIPLNEVRILTPQTGVIGDRSTNLVVQYNADAQIQVSVNEKPLNPSTSTDQKRDEAQNTITQAWYNIPLEKGDNTLTVQAGNGTPVGVKLTVKDISARIEVAPVGDPRVPADGRSILTLAGKITDENGELIREDTRVTLTAGAGKFVGADEDKDQPGFQVMARGGQFTAQLQSGLQAQKVLIRAAAEQLGQGTQERTVTPPLPPPAQGNTGDVASPPGEVNNSITPSQPRPLNPSPLEVYTQVEFITNLRPSLVSGVVNLRIGAAGTDFWGSRSDFLNPDTIDDGTQFDLTGAVFATGKLGEWLFTGAYNSDRALNQTCDGTISLFRGPQFCEQQYPVYGDSSTVDYLTPSTDSVYLRFERTSPVPGAEPDYGMWGDYNTQEFARSSQLFTSSVRQLHGFKGNYNLGNLQLTALYSPDIQGFQRDTIAPNGTSGYYFLSQRLLIEGSENVFIETEENNRPGTVIERKPLSRGTDYEIDYDRGTLLFRYPILSTEVYPFDTTTGEPGDGLTLLVRRIVVTYQYENAGEDTNLYAGRLQYNFSQEFNSESWLGATYWREDEGMQDFELYGADFRVALGNNGQLIGEYAHSSNNSIYLGNITGSAYRFELNAGITPSLTSRAYYRSVEEGFVNNATTSFTPGQTRYGAAIAYKLGPNTSFQAGYDHEDNFGIAPAEPTDFFDIYDPGPEPIPGSAVDNELTTIRAGIQQQIGAATFGVDYVHRSREDRISDDFDGDASQIVSKLGIPLSQALTFRAQNELNLGDSDPLYPNRTTFGLDWRAYPGITVRLAHQFFDGGLMDSDSITSLDTIVEQKLGENTSLTGRYSVIGGFNGITGQGAVGLNHRWVIAPGLRANLTYEHTFSNTSDATAAGDRFAQPYAVGQSASSLALLGGDVYGVGIEYTDNPDFKASARFEHRTGSSNDNTVFSIAAAGKLSPALTALARYEQANFANQEIEGLEDSATLRLGLAYRNPASDRWNALLRYEYRKNPSTIPDTLLVGSGTGSNEHLFAMEAIYAPNWRWEFYGKGALRYSQTDQADDFTNSATVFLSQLRAAYRLGYRMDLAVEGRWIGQSEPTFNEFGFALETGYYLTPDLRIGVGYSFGSVDDRDFTGYRSEGGPYLSLTFKVNELFGGFGRQKVVPPQQQESNVEPVASDKPPATSAVNTTSEE